jgi:hypothetical protein
MILAWMAAGEHELSADTYEEYFDEVEEFYLNYDYSVLMPGT